MNWRPECEEAFHCLKEYLCVPPVLASPNFNQPFIIQTDASERGIGAVLSQLGGDQQEQKIVATRAELCYSRERVLSNCSGHPVPSRLPLWPRVYCPVRTPCFIVLDRMKDNNEKVELNFAKLPVHGAAQAGQGECECGRSVQSLQTRMCMTVELEN